MAQARYTSMEKTRMRNLQYGPKTRLIQGIYRVEPRYNEGPMDWQNLLAVTRFRYIETYCLVGQISQTPNAFKNAKTDYKRKITSLPNIGKPNSLFKTSFTSFCFWPIVCCILTRPSCSPKYCVTRKHIQSRYYTLNRPIRFIFNYFNHTNDSSQKPRLVLIKNFNAHTFHRLWVNVRLDHCTFILFFT